MLRGKNTLAKYVASGEGLRPLQWYECEDHGEGDHEEAGGGRRASREPIEAWFDRVLPKETSVEELIDKSSLGDPEAKRIRSTANPDLVNKVLKRTDEISSRGSNKS
jgi:hypothetical protein